MWIFELLMSIKNTFSGVNHSEYHNNHSAITRAIQNKINQIGGQLGNLTASRNSSIAHLVQVTGFHSWPDMSQFSR